MKPTRDYMLEEDYEQALSYSPAQARADELASENYLLKRDLENERVWTRYWEALYRETLAQYISKL